MTEPANADVVTAAVDLREEGERRAMAILRAVHPDRMGALTDALYATLQASGATAPDALAALALMIARITADQPDRTPYTMAVGLMIEAHAEALRHGAAMASAHPTAHERAGGLANLAPAGTA